MSGLSFKDDVGVVTPKGFVCGATVLRAGKSVGRIHLPLRGQQHYRVSFRVRGDTPVGYRWVGLKWRADTLAEAKQFVRQHWGEVQKLLLVALDQ